MNKKNIQKNSDVKYTDLTKLSLSNNNKSDDIDVSNSKPMNWSIPINYNKKVEDKTLEPTECKRRQTIIDSFLADSVNGCNDDTKTLADIIFIQQKNLFLTGWGGVGKSYQMKLMYKLAKKIYTKHHSVIICSTTGSSALNLGIPDSSTINSWSGILIENRNYRKIENGEYIWCEEEGKNYLKNIGFKVIHTEILFLDECSMLGGFMLKTLDAVCKQIKKNDLPFGGIQLFFSGDMLQLPPVGDVFPFLYKVWDHLNFVYYRLNKCYRQSNQEWADLLGKIRITNVFKKGEKTYSTLDEKSIKTLKTRSCVIKENVPTYCLWLYCKNLDANQHNTNCLNALTGEELHTNISFDSVIVESKNERILTDSNLNNTEVNKDINWTPIDDYSSFNSKLRKQFAKDVGSILKEVDNEFKFKIGSRVMCKKNIHKGSGLVNGARGIIKNVEYKDKPIMVEGEIITSKVCNRILVQFSYGENNMQNGCTEVDFTNYLNSGSASTKSLIDDSPYIGNQWFTAISPNEAWFELYDFQNIEYISPTLRIIRTRKQFPFVLSWAITCHKSQGLTLTDVAIDMKNCFAAGQSYVSLSRCKSLENVHIFNFDPKYLYSDVKAIKFDKHVDERKINKEN
jgi:ATP-dependent DNA helicase PIF1